MQKILFALRDIGSARMLGPLAPLLREKGIDVVTYLEGQAVRMYPELSGEAGSVVLNDADKALMTREQFAAKLAELFAEKIDAVVVGNSTPPGGEVDIAHMANEKNIPLIVMDDIGGGWKRIPNMHPALIITTTEVASERARQVFPGAQSAAAGIPSIPKTPIAVPPELTEKLDELRSAFGAVVFFAPFGARSVSAVDEQVRFFAECMKLSSNPAIVTSVHPKSRDVDVGGMRYVDRWMQTLHEAFGKHLVDLEGTFSGDIFAAAADATVSGGGSVLLRSAYAGKRAVRMVTPSIIQLTLEETDSEEYPFHGAMPEIDTPTDIFSLSLPDADFLQTLTPYDAKIALVAVCSLLK